MSQVRTVSESVPHIYHYINGQKVERDTGRSLEVHNPASGEVTASVALADAATTREAIQAAKDALPAWQAVTPLNRARVMFRYKALIEKHFEEIAQLITREHGKVIEDARGELTRGLEIV